MKKFSFYFLFPLAMLICFLNCKNSSPKKKDAPVIKFFKEGRFLIKETFDSSGSILIKQYFNKDTVPDGAMIEYYPNSTIATWRWFLPKQKNPNCGIFYNENGTFDTLKGRVFLDLGEDKDHNPVIIFINPPQLKIRIGYKDVFKNKILKEKNYDPILTDSTGSVALDEYKYAKGHDYILYFYVVNTIDNKVLYNDSIYYMEHISGL